MRYLILLLLCSVAFADDIAPPKPDEKLSVETQEYLKDISDNLHKMEIVTDRPNGTRRGNRGEYVGWATGSNIQLNICKSTPSGVVWVAEGKPEAAVSGSGVVQVVNYQTGAMQTNAATIPFDDTIPLKTEGFEYYSLSITPKSATNILKIDVVFFYELTANDYFTVGLFQDATANALACGSRLARAATETEFVSFTHWMTSGTTSSTTFKVISGGNSGTTTLNGLGGARKFGGVLASSITITEITP